MQDLELFIKGIKKWEDKLGFAPLNFIDSNKSNLDFSKIIQFKIPSFFRKKFIEIVDFELRAKEFLALCCFIDRKTLQNPVIFDLIFLLFFKTSQFSIISKHLKCIYKKIKRKIKEEMNFPYLGLDIIINSIEIEMFIKDFIIKIKPSISFSQLISEFYYYYRKNYLEKISIYRMRNHINDINSLDSWLKFEKNSSNLSLNSIIVDPMLNYNKIGLIQYKVYLFFPINTYNSITIIKKLFTKMDFASNFTFLAQNIFSFFIFIPTEQFKRNFESILSHLRLSGHIVMYNLLNYKNLENFCRFPSKISKTSSLSKLTKFYPKIQRKELRESFKFSENRSNLSKFHISPLFLTLFFKMRRSILFISFYPE
jgi:hypothetical protein